MSALAHQTKLLFCITYSCLPKDQGSFSEKAIFLVMDRIKSEKKGLTPVFSGAMQKLLARYRKRSHQERDM
jgi:hypothetical protein